MIHHSRDSEQKQWAETQVQLHTYNYLYLMINYPRCVGGHGYSSRLVCLFVTHESAHLAATALRLQHG